MGKSLSDIKHIYVFRYNGIYKIGVSCNVQKRLLELKCGCPTIEAIYESDFIKNPFVVEKNLHNIFEKYSIAGEWFSYVDLDLLDSIVKATGEFADIEAEIKKEKEKRKEFNKKIHNLVKRVYGIKDNIHCDIREKLDIENGWKFTESDKEFLLKYYLEYADILKNYCDCDGIDDVYKIIDSIQKHGVVKSKDLIQEDAVCMAECVQWEIYEYYNGDKDVLRLLENSILT